MSRITVITICLNAALRLERCVQSVLNQSRLPDEYIFVDGGSTDGTLQLIEKLSLQLKNSGIDTQLLHQVKQPGEAGIPSAWNQGINNASGDIIALLNSDDFYEPNALQTAEKALANGADILFAAINLVNENLQKVGEIHPKCLCMQEIMMAIPHPACFVTKNLYNKIGLYDTTYRISADYDFIWRCKKAKANCVYFQDCLTNMETGGTANSSRALARNETCKIALKYSCFPPLPLLAWLLRKISGR